MCLSWKQKDPLLKGTFMPLVEQICAFHQWKKWAFFLRETWLCLLLKQIYVSMRSKSAPPRKAKKNIFFLVVSPAEANQCFHEKQISVSHRKTHFFSHQNLRKSKIQKETKKHLIPKNTYRKILKKHKVTSSTRHMATAENAPSDALSAHKNDSYYGAPTRGTLWLVAPILQSFGKNYVSHLSLTRG